MTRGAGEGPVTAVVTGASSGIGRAIAHALGERRMTLVLAARDPGTLEDAAVEAKSHGARAVTAVPTDVSRAAEVEALAGTAIDQMGGIDVWVNNASVMVYGRFEDIPSEVYRQVIETNLLGTIEASRAAMRHFRARERGHLINIGSLYAKMTSPFVGPYVVSKFGLVGFSEVLRQETMHEPGIHVSLVHPGSMDSPIFRHAANYVGRPTRPVPPVSDVRRVSRVVSQLIDRPEATVVVGNSQRLLSWAKVVFPRLYDQLVPEVMDASGLDPGGAPVGPGNVFEPRPEWNRLRGSWNTRGDLAAVGRGLVAGGKKTLELIRALPFWRV